MLATSHVGGLRFRLVKAKDRCAGRQDSGETRVGLGSGRNGERAAPSAPARCERHPEQPHAADPEQQEPDASRQEQTEPRPFTAEEGPIVQRLDQVRAAVRGLQPAPRSRGRSGPPQPFATWEEQAEIRREADCAWPLEVERAAPANLQGLRIRGEHEDARCQSAGGEQVQDESLVAEEGEVAAAVVVRG